MVEDVPTLGINPNIDRDIDYFAHNLKRYIQYMGNVVNRRQTFTDRDVCTALVFATFPMYLSFQISN